ncbi:MAG TPA: YbjQ family protein [Gemmatimonadales bacterium]|nr:YbjQ family protein [Gemmatimonadales bacterium]
MTAARVPARRGIDARMTTTAMGFDGYFVGEQFGVVRGVSVRSRSIVGNFAAKMQQIFGGDITILTRLCEGARQDAFEIMLAHAERLGANAVLGVRYDATEIMMGVTEVLCYGTAVAVEQLPEETA